VHYVATRKLKNAIVSGTWLRSPSVFPSRCTQILIRLITVWKRKRRRQRRSRKLVYLLTLSLRV